MRSKLFVPGSRPELFAKALAGPADAISIDLEDAVEESRKGEARAMVAAFLATRRREADGKILIVRVNAQATLHFAADIAAVVGPNLDLLNLSKVENDSDVRAASHALALLETERGMARTPLLVNIETPQSLRRAAEIAKSDPRVIGLQLGLADLLEPLGIDRGDKAAVHHLQLAVRLAAGEAGIWCCDAAYADISDSEGYRAEAIAARRLGFIGKSCIHPSQAPLANTVFQPSGEEIAAARRVIEAAREATAKGIGAFMVDGRMVDAPFVRRAEAVVALADRLGLLPGAGKAAG